MSPILSALAFNRKNEKLGKIQIHGVLKPPLIFKVLEGVHSYSFPFTQVNEASKISCLPSILPVGLLGRVMALRLCLIVSAPLVVS